MPLLDANRTIHVDPSGRATTYNQQRLKNATFSKVGGGASIDLGDEAIPGAGEFGDTVDSAAKTAHKRGGLVEGISTDIGHTKDFGSQVGSILGGKGKELDPNASSLGDLKKAGSTYLEGMGRGSKTLGAAKIGAYMVGASMLVDMLNPFGD